MHGHIYLYGKSRNKFDCMKMYEDEKTLGH